ncbi:MAG: hypothetical protein ACOYOK_12730 [Pseudobdellovibrionaceae bacterium]
MKKLFSFLICLLPYAASAEVFNLNIPKLVQGYDLVEFHINTEVTQMSCQLPPGKLVRKSASCCHESFGGYWILQDNVAAHCSVASGLLVNFFGFTESTLVAGDIEASMGVAKRLPGGAGAFEPKDLLDAEGESFLLRNIRPTGHRLQCQQKGLQVICNGRNSTSFVFIKK